MADAGADHDPDFDDDTEVVAAQVPAEVPGEEVKAEAADEAALAKPKKKKKKRNKAGEDAAGPNQDGAASTEALPSIFEAPKTGQIMEVLNADGGVAADEEDEEAAGQKVAGEAIEISDDEAPDVDEAKRNLRDLAQKKLKAKKTTVGGVTRDVQVEGSGETPALPDVLPPSGRSENQPQN